MRGYVFVLALTSVFGANYGAHSTAAADDSVSLTVPQNVVSSVADPPKIAAPTPIQAAIASSMPLGPSTIADIAEAVAPSVVTIDVSQKVANTPTPDYPSNPFQFFFNPNMLMPRSRSAQNMGSGFIIRPDGYIVTNAHVVKSGGKITVALNDGRHFPGILVGVDPYTDIAVVKIEADKLPVARLGTNKGLRPGDFCIAIGSPLQLRPQP